MDLNFRVETSLDQQQHLTLEIRQGVALLGLGAQDLADYVIQCAEDNPFFDADELWAGSETTNEKFQVEYSVDELFESQTGAWRKGFDSPRGEGFEGDFSFENYAAENETLEEHVEHQINELAQSDDLRTAELWIAGNLDEDGYFRLPNDEAVNLCPGGSAVFDQALATVQSFDPCGIGARNLEECLLIQLKAEGELDEPSEQFIAHHLRSLARKSRTAIAREIGIDEPRLEQILTAIRSCDPRPGLRFSQSARTVWPEVVVEWDENARRFRVRLQDVLLPRLAIDHEFEKLAEGVQEGKARSYLDVKRREAHALVNGINQRKQTICSVACSIVDAEQDFFLRGYDFLVPLTMAKTAEEIGVSESTVSRVANSCYLQSPRGVYAFRYFFHAGLKADAGDVSSHGAKRRLQQIIAAEDPAHPLSDQALADVMTAEGLPLSRRTVNKYRAELGIPSCSARRKAH